MNGEQGQEVQPQYTIPSSQEVINKAYQAQAQSSLIEWQLSPQLILVEIEDYLIGAFYDEDGKKQIDKTRRFMNNKGINFLIGTLKGIVNPNTVLSNLDDREICRITTTTLSDIAINLGFDNDEYELDLKKLPSIISFIGNMIFITLKRSEDKTTLKFLKETERVQQTNIVGQPEKKRSLFGFRI